MELQGWSVFFQKRKLRRLFFSIDKDKSPRLDGFSSLFYQGCREIVKDLMEVSKEFHDRGTINKCTNVIFIVLIPKEDVNGFSDFRPISLVSSLYKIIAKVLYMRLKNVLGGLVSNSQGVFMKGRQITNRILVVNELVDGRKRSKELGLVYKTDLENAYDQGSKFRFLTTRTWKRIKVLVDTYRKSCKNYINDKNFREMLEFF